MYKLCRLAIVAAAYLLTLGHFTFLQAQADHSGDFIISQNGKSVGTASFKQLAAAGGIDSTAAVQVDMEGLKYTLSKTEVLGADHHLQHAELSATVNGSTVALQVAQEGAQWGIHIAAGDKKSTNQLAVHAATVVLADFDPGAFETLLSLAAVQNSRDLWALIPKQSGSIEPIQIATYMDEHGTLDGKPIVAHHLILTIAGAKTELFSSPENQLLQVELTKQGFALVRKGFVLTPPAKPVVQSE